MEYLLYTSQLWCFPIILRCGARSKVISQPCLALEAWGAASSGTRTALTLNLKHPCATSKSIEWYWMHYDIFSICRQTAGWHEPVSRGTLGVGPLRSSRFDVLLCFASSEFIDVPCNNWTMIKNDKENILNSFFPSNNATKRIICIASVQIAPDRKSVV